MMSTHTPGQPPAPQSMQPCGAVQTAKLARLRGYRPFGKFSLTASFNTRWDNSLVMNKVYIHICDGEEGAKLAMILEQACIDQRVGRELERMWRSQFEKRPASQSTRS